MAVCKGFTSVCLFFCTENFDWILDFEKYDVFNANHPVPTKNVEYVILKSEFLFKYIFFFCKFVKREFVVCKKFNLFKWEKSRKVDNYNLLAEYTTMIHYRCYGDRCNTWSEKELIT